MPRRRKFPDYVEIRVPVYQPPASTLELLFEGKTLEIAKRLVEYLKKNDGLFKDEYQEALGMIYEDRGMYRLSDRFSERMESLAKMWKFEIGKVAELW